MGTLSCIFFLVLGYYGLLAIADSLEVGRGVAWRLCVYISCTGLGRRFNDLHSPFSLHTCPLAQTRSTQRPFAYTHGSFNIELESFGLKFHDDMLQVARLFSDDNESFLPQYLSSADSAKRAEGKEAGKETKA